jgi:hypothetical protein
MEPTSVKASSVETSSMKSVKASAMEIRVSLVVRSAKIVEIPCHCHVRAVSQVRRRMSGKATRVKTVSWRGATH